MENWPEQLLLLAVGLGLFFALSAVETHENARIEVPEDSVTLQFVNPTRDPLTVHAAPGGMLGSAYPKERTCWPLPRYARWLLAYHYGKPVAQSPEFKPDTASGWTWDAQSLSPAPRCS